MQEQQVNEEFDAAGTSYQGRRAAGAIRYQVNWEIQALDQAAGFLRDDLTGVAALWDSDGQLADELRTPESFLTGRRSAGRAVPRLLHDR